MHFGARRRIPGSGASAVGHLSVGSPCREGQTLSRLGACPPMRRRRLGHPVVPIASVGGPRKGASVVAHVSVGHRSRSRDPRHPDGCGSAAVERRPLRCDRERACRLSRRRGRRRRLHGVELDAAWTRSACGAGLHTRLCVSVDLGLPPHLPRAADWSTLQQIESAGVESVPQQDAATAILTLTHESYHLRFDSSDESRVNACALRDFGSVLVNQFAVPQTVEQSQSAPVTATVRVRQAIWRTIHGKRVRRYVYRYVSKTTYVASTVTVANPAYESLVSAAQSFVVSQPPPYNSGTCS